MKLLVTCPTCGVTGQLDLPAGHWDTIEGDILHGKVRPGRVCEHGFTFELHRSGEILKYGEWEAKPAEIVQPVKFTVQSATRNLTDEVLATLITAGISETPCILVGFPAVTLGIKEFFDRILPETVEFNSVFTLISREEYAALPDNQRQGLIVEISGRKIHNSPFDEEQLEWIRRVLVRAKMISNQQAAENLVYQEAKKLQMTVSMLRHIAARRTSDQDEDPEASSEEFDTTDD